MHILCVIRHVPWRPCFPTNQICLNNPGTTLGLQFSVILTSNKGRLMGEYIRYVYQNLGELKMDRIKHSFLYSHLNNE